MARRLRPLGAMAKTRRRATSVPAPARDVAASQFSGDATAGSGDRERIAERAYQLYKQRGGGHGRDLDDWLEAERDLARTRNRGSTNPDNAA